MQKTISDELLGEITRRILSVAQPERIILFGSAARGEMTPDSDIDILVVEQNPENTRRESVRIGDALRGLGYPFDVIVMAKDYFEASKEWVGTLAKPANDIGRVIYAA